MSEPTAAASAIDRLIGLMVQLRGPGGCPWDREQTPASLKPQMLEECYEVLEAIDSGSPIDLKEELGDLLLHVVFQTQIAQESGAFNFAQVANGLADKLVGRHPHVFGEEKVADSTETIARWQELKKREKPERKSALDGVPRSLPALMRAEVLQKKAQQAGLAPPDLQESVGKAREAMEKVLDSLRKEGPVPATPAAKEELGDLLFSLVNVTRSLKLDAEDLLTRANDNFSLGVRASEERAPG